MLVQLNDLVYVVADERQPAAQGVDRASRPVRRYRIAGCAGVPRNSSGAMNVGVPARGALPCARSSSRRTRPKSVSLARPSGVSSTLAGLTSRCTRPASCAACRAQHHLLGQHGGTQRLERALPHQRFTQRQPARHVFHLDEMKPVQTAEVMNRHDMRVNQVRRGPRLGPELFPNPRLFARRAPGP